MPKYEYMTFTETIVESEKNLYAGEGWPFGGGVPRTPGAGLAQDIDAAVDILLASGEPEGWEPAEAIDARSLTRARHVTAEYTGSFLGLGGGARIG